MVNVAVVQIASAVDSGDPVARREVGWVCRFWCHGSSPKKCCVHTVIHVVDPIHQPRQAKIVRLQQPISSLSDLDNLVFLLSLMLRVGAASGLDLNEEFCYPIGNYRYTMNIKHGKTPSY